MRLLAKNIEPDGSGSVTLMPEHEDDLWPVYNLMCEGDALTAGTMR